MIDLIKYGFSFEDQQVYDMVYKYSRDELYPLSKKWIRTTGFQNRPSAIWLTSACWA